MNDTSFLRKNGENKSPKLIGDDEEEHALLKS
jgi:hypothetical protein